MTGPVRRRLAPKPIALGLLAGLTVSLTIGGWAGLVAGSAAGVWAYRWLARRPSGDQVAADRQIRAELPFAADLLAAALRAGAPPDIAAQCVGGALTGPLSDQLGRVTRALRLGAPAAEAWAYLGETVGAQRIARAATRSQHSGAAFAGSLQRVADDLRSDLLVAADSEARRAGVLIVLPLGLCFLPAFVLAGLVPVLVAILGDVLSR
jgi:pilus assembly protein TadC